MIKKAQQGKVVKKSKGLPPAGKQRPVDFEPKSKFPVTPGGGDNYDATISRERDLKKKGVMKMGGSMKKAQSGKSVIKYPEGPVESNKISLPTGRSNKFTIPGPKNKITIPSRNKITIPRMDKAKSGGSFPDLNKDGKITKADILKGRGVIAKKGAKVAKMAKCKYGCK